MRKEYAYAFKGSTPKERYNEFFNPEGLFEKISKEVHILSAKDKQSIFPFPVTRWFQYGKLMAEVYALLFDPEGKIGSHIDSFISFAKTRQAFEISDKIAVLKNLIIAGVEMHSFLLSIGVTEETAHDVPINDQWMKLHKKYVCTFVQNHAKAVCEIESVVSVMV